MAASAYTFTQMTLAATDVEGMVRFYNAVFAANLQPITAHGTTLYRRTLHGLEFLICPNSLAGVVANQNRHQFAYTVADLPAMVASAHEAGGVVLEDRSTSSTATVLDPDGNTIVFVQGA